jgi:subtilisin family serine protease
LVRGEIFFKGPEFAPKLRRDGTPRAIFTVMRRVLILFAAGPALLALAAPATAGQPTGRLLVSLDEQPSVRAHAATAQAVAARAGVRRARPDVPQIGLMTVRVPADRSAASAARVLRSLPGVASVQREERAQLRYVPNDPSLTAPEPAGPPGTPLQWWALRQGLPAAWDFTRGAEATVAVIDTGIDAGHPEFAGLLGETADFDDNPSHGVATGDEVGHGTHVASIACAAGDNAFGLTGAGFGCKLIVAKTDLSDGSIARSIVWAADHGADAINMSFGTDGTRAAADAVVRAVDYAYGRGVVLVGAAADEATEEQGDPANLLQPTGSGPDISQGKGLSVTAANFYDQRASFAGFGSQISLAAYGAFQSPNGPRGIFGAFPGNTTEIETGSLVPPTAPCSCRTEFNGDGRYAYLQGTSMAVPMVAATAAVVRRINPDLGAAGVIRLIKETATRPPGSEWSPNLGWGILNGGAAVVRARVTDLRAPSSRLGQPASTRSTRVKLHWSGTDTAPPGLVASGVERFEVWRSANGRGFRKLTSTRGRSLVTRVKRGSRYAYYTVAIDRAGNREAAPSVADARIRIPRRAPRR